MKLKIRSPYKSPSKSVPKSKDILLENQKIQMKLCKMRENLGKNFRKNVIFMGYK